jgi:poly(3-hydroxyalkanoate) synthetase
MLSTAIRYKKYIEAITPAAPEFFTANNIIHETPILRVRMFRHDPYGESTLVIPPDAGHDSTVADQADGKSIVQTILSAKTGSVFCVDWKPATQETKNTTFEDIIKEIHVAIYATSGSCKTHIVGLCAGGVKATIFTALYPDKVSRLSIIGTPIDFRIGGGAMVKLVDTLTPEFYKFIVKWNNGVMPGKLLLMGWKNLNPIERYFIDFQEIWNSTNDDYEYAKIIRNRAWYENHQDVAGGWYVPYVIDMFSNNKLVKGEYYVGERRVVLERITCRVDVINGAGDKITLTPQCFALTDYISTPKHLITRTILPKVSHLGSFLSRSVQKPIGMVLQ